MVDAVRDLAGAIAPLHPVAQCLAIVCLFLGAAFVALLVYLLITRYS